VPIGLPVLVIFMELGVGVLQAYIFALLSTIYIGLMTSHGDDHH
jgi:F-type H+-transporting ATPase subunit a